MPLVAARCRDVIKATLSDLTQFDSYSIRGLMFSTHLLPSLRHRPISCE